MMFGRQPRLQFRMAMLLYITVWVALLAAAWSVWGRPNIAGMHVEQGQLVLQLSDTAALAMLPDDPYIQGLASAPHTYLHDAYVAFPLWSVAVGVVLTSGLAIGFYWCLRDLVRRFRRKGEAAGAFGKWK